MGLNVPEGGHSEPQQEDKLEGVVKGEPVNHTKEALQDTVQIVRSGILAGPSSEGGNLREEGEHNPVLQRQGD